MPEELIEDIKRRCEAGGLSYAEFEDSLRIDFPMGERTHGVWVYYGHDEQARAVLGVPFEDYVLLDGYGASWSPKRREIECPVARYDRGRLKSPDYEEATARGTLRELGLDLDPAIPLDPSQRVYFDVKGDASVSVGLRTNVQAVLDEALPNADDTKYLTLLMEDIEVETHDDAVDLLERVGNAIFLEVGISDGPLLELGESSNYYTDAEEALAELSDLVSKRERQKRGGEVFGTAALRSVRFEYERAPSKLYAYGGVDPPHARTSVLDLLSGAGVLLPPLPEAQGRARDQEALGRRAVRHAEGGGQARAPGGHQAKVRGQQETRARRTRNA